MNESINQPTNQLIYVVIPNSTNTRGDQKVLGLT